MSTWPWGWAACLDAATTIAALYGRRQRVYRTTGGHWTWEPQP